MSALPTVAVILAGGQGTRIGRELPKQLIEIANRPVIEYTIAAFHQHQQIDQILVMMVGGYEQPLRDLLGDRYPKVSAVLTGGETRSATTAAALAALGDRDCNVLLHDAARPLVSERIITDCIRALSTWQAVGTAIECTDTVVEVQPSRQDPMLTVIAHTLPRPALRRCQTPQGFRLSVIRKAHQAAAADPHFAATDDCSVVLRYLPDTSIAVVPGETRNLKITEPADLDRAEQLLCAQASTGAWA